MIDGNNPIGWTVAVAVVFALLNLLGWLIVDTAIKSHRRIEIDALRESQKQLQFVIVSLQENLDQWRETAAVFQCQAREWEHRAKRAMGEEQL